MARTVRYKSYPDEAQGMCTSGALVGISRRHSLWSEADLYLLRRRNEVDMHADTKKCGPRCGWRRVRQASAAAPERMKKRPNPTSPTTEAYLMAVSMRSAYREESFQMA